MTRSQRRAERHVLSLPVRSVYTRTERLRMELISVTVGVQDPINKDVSVPEGKEDHWT